MLKTANTPNEEVRELQRQLWACAKRSKTRRFHALYDRIYRSDVLWEAWRRVRGKGGAAGIVNPPMAGGGRDFVAMCRSESGAREALRRIGLVMDRPGLRLHPAKTRLVGFETRQGELRIFGMHVSPLHRLRSISAPSQRGLDLCQKLPYASMFDGLDGFSVDPQTAEHSAQPSLAFPAALAKPQGNEEDPTARSRID